jgi:hypothetical protein
MNQSETIGKLAEALSKAQAAMENALKDSTNPFFKGKYADLAGIINAIKLPLGQNGLSYVQYLDTEGDFQYLYTKLMHISGEWLQGRLRLLIGKNDMQGLGSAITYARRYTLSAMVGLTQEDDDGERSSFRMTIVEINKLKQLGELGGYNFDAICKSVKERYRKDDPLYLTEKEYEDACDRLMKAKEK